MNIIGCGVVFGRRMELKYRLKKVNVNEIDFLKCWNCIYSSDPCNFFHYK